MALQVTKPVSAISFQLPADGSRDEEARKVPAGPVSRMALESLISLIFEKLAGPIVFEKSVGLKMASMASS